MGAEILDSAIERVPLTESDGRSGVPLERVLLADGTRLVVKRGSLAEDMVAARTGDGSGREIDLWREGVLDRLPPGVGHAVIDGWYEDGVVTTVMRDLGDDVLRWTDRVPRETYRRVVAAVHAVHRAFRDSPPASACDLAARLTLMAPGPAAQLTERFGLASAIVEGWQAFHEIAPHDVVDAVDTVFADPAPLVDAFSARDCTLIHADLVYVNLAVTDHEIVLLDWNLATWAPPALEMSFFVTGCASATEATREEMFDEYRAIAGRDLDELALRLTMFQGLIDLGWNKALDALHHEDPDTRAVERADLEWWIARAREVLDDGLLAL